MKELGEYLKRTRISSGLSTTEVCEDLDFSTSQLENIESGNVRAFKDVYALRELIKKYSNYLGLKSDEVIDEFNGFLFEHTTKISIDDIKNAQKLSEENQKKVRSPYTIKHKEPIRIWPIVYTILGVILLFIIVYVIVYSINKSPEKTNELMPIVERMMY